MIRKTYPVDVQLNNTPFLDCGENGLLFFDIETTGLTARSSCVYLIGAVSRKSGRWEIVQWFSESPREERAILQEFLRYAGDFSQIIHFNGDRFDLPYLAEKCRAHHLENTLDALVSRDLYRMIRPLKPLLGLSSLKQKSLEEYLGLYREDRFDGGELISVYLDYVMLGGEDRLSALLLHNYEDLLGMLSILPLLSCCALTDGNYQAADAISQEDAVTIRAWLPAALPKAVSYETPLYRLRGEKSALHVTVPVLRGTLKHFFSDYKNYFYLPAEDMAIHKSVAVYVDKNYRHPAKAGNCYTKKDGVYLPQRAPLFEPVFKQSFQDRLCYFACTDAFLQDRAQLQQYLRHLLEDLKETKKRPGSS